MRIHRWLRSHIKLVLAAGLYYTGALLLLMRWRLRHRGVVLLYHRVLPETERAQSCSSRAIVVSPDTFDRHLRFLKNHFSVLGPEEFRDWLLHGRQTTRPPCLITFDDGWKDNLTYARPLLKSHGLPAVIFLPTDYIGTGRLFWQERLTRLLNRLAREPKLRLHPLVTEHELASLFDGADTVITERAGDIARSFKNRKLAETETLIGNLERILDGHDNTEYIDTYLSWDDVHALRPDRIAFGSHTVTHRILTGLGTAEIHEEFAESKRLLEQRLGAPVDLLAYPNGNHNDETCQEAARAGYHLAFTTVPGQVARGDNPMRLHRINIHDGAHRHLPVFCASIAGVL